MQPKVFKMFAVNENHHNGAAYLRCSQGLKVIVPLKKIEYGFGVYYNKTPIYSIFFLL